MNDYEKQAEKFLKDTNTTFKAEFLKNGSHFPNDTEARDIYTITLTRGGRFYKFDFGQSIKESGFILRDKNTKKEAKYIWIKELEEAYNKDRDKDKLLRAIHLNLEGGFGFRKDIKPFEVIYGKIPTAYDVLSCLTKHEINDFDDFCDEFGYDTDSRKAEKIYKAVVEEWKNVKILWSDEEIEELQEIN